ncbi:hypothetical protein PISL3812_08726 [Talaromyces islandicus]|uniref:Uncharacterized protein n=1 Tax=Talaromyces islandicus TaxID=28573 RepID=A0A0U1M9T4_TALIS|nr:hypothetical protein PISL3812_08726 [Talaromyces islandicus]
MEAAALPPGLQHLAPMSSETVFLLGVTAFMGTDNQDFMYPSMFETLIQGYLDAWDDNVVEANYLHLIDHLVDGDVLQAVEMFDKPIAYIPKYDLAGFLTCFTLEQKSTLFSAAVQLLLRLSPTRMFEDTTYLEWPDYAEYMRETNDRQNAILLAEVALKIIDRQVFPYHIDLIKARFLNIKGSVSIQLLDYTSAKEALERSIEIHEAYEHAGDNIEVLNSQTHLASLAAAQGKYEESASLSWKVWLLLSSPHFNGDDDDTKRLLQIHVSTLAAKVATLVGKYGEAIGMLDHAATLFDETIDNPVFHRSILHAFGNLYYAEGSMTLAKECYQACTHSSRFGTVMQVNQADEERTISVYHRLAVMDVKDEKARAARSKVQAALKMCKNTRSPYMLPWKGRLELTWAEILRKFHYFAGCWERKEKDHPEKHEDAAQQVAAELGIVTVGLVKDEQFANLLPWDIR